jgi:hypothetical protein
MKPADIVFTYLIKTELSERAFAEALTEKLANVRISNTSVNNWRRGKTEPETDFLLTCLVSYQDWRRDFAEACLIVKLPHVFLKDADGRLVLSVAA